MEVALVCRIRLIVAVLTLGLLAGCQGPTQDILDIESPVARQARNARQLTPQETVGAGSLRMGLITARMAPFGETVRERDVRDGAALAVDELGGGSISLLVENTDGSPQAVRDAARRLAEQSVKLVALTAANVPMDIVREGMGAQRVPIVALRSGSQMPPAGTFSFMSDRIDSAVEGASYAVASGRSRLVILLPSDLSAPERQYLDRGLASYRIKPVLVAANAAKQILAEPASKAMFKDIDAVLLVGSGEAEAMFLAQLRANGHLRPNAIVLGTTAWDATSYKRSEFAGSLLCMFGPENGSRMAAKYRERYERVAGADAAYGFDVVALVAGLVRAQGDGAITDQNMKSTDGFVGAAAAFRFEKDGSVRRTCAIHQVEGGKLIEVDPAPRSF